MARDRAVQTHEIGDQMLALRDALDILNGKWKIAIMCSLNTEKKRFRDLQRDVGGITGKMLSKELKDLEINELVIRNVLDTKPVSVEYELTDYGKSLERVLLELVNWGINHRKHIMGKKPAKNMLTFEQTDN